ncbi:Tetratricopeptide TPR_2 repeat-containing protein (plasmid) [Thalassoporum mexicanum PCC 7367]|uniref:tetratricopeptide repeat protein n=1 Tax=Thalassoporum mexicanum TaxID=3457544 RepID=UPI00029FDDF8|nr:tetratricopeptide repeat protein [Pseudanabaena sp. PCC 7367]AFY72066.1 Tetratricopeptide TPR_2 repeat-containing protein [Pseudanabaena sp. PCC 7367]
MTNQNPTSIPANRANQIETYFNLGNQAYYKNKKTEAKQYYRQCLQLKPDWLNALYNIGVVCTELEQWPEATKYLGQVIAIKPDHAHAYNYLGIIARRQNQLIEAVLQFQTAIAIKYQFPDAHFNLGMTLLQMGRLIAGFAESEWRWQTDRFTPLNCPQPQWQGEDISQQSILVHTEQGAGDAIQFIRYMPLLIPRCKQVILCCPDHLVALFKPIAGIAQIYTAGAIPLSEFSTFAPLMSLPHLLRTTLNTIPNQVPYLDIEPDRKEKMAALFSKSNSNPKVGIVWAGSPTHTDDRNRSCTLRDLLPILELANLNFYSLQKGPQETELNQLPDAVQINDLSPHIHDYMDTAAAIDHLDLVIGVDTSVVHLAGALGKSVWVMLSHSPDWRWLLDRSDTPWYPTMRLFRQSQPRHWQDVVEAIVENLTSIIVQ